MRFPHPHIDRFLDAIRPWHAAYGDSLVSFLAVRRDNALVIVRAAVKLSATSARAALKPPFRTKSIAAGEARFNGTLPGLEDFIATLVRGQPVPLGDLVMQFAVEPARPPSAHHTERGEHGAFDRTEVERLTIGGASRYTALGPEDVFEKELRPHGFGSIADLGRMYALELHRRDSAVGIEIVAEPAARLDASSSLVRTEATISVRLAKPLPRELLTLVVVDTASRGQEIRQSMSGAAGTWREVDSEQVGSFVVRLPKYAVITCRTIYEGAVHDEIELLDPKALPNPRRMLVELVDPGLLNLHGPLTHPKAREEQNEHEGAVQVVFFMLGIDGVRVGVVKTLRKSSDIFGIFPSGERVLVESTTEILDPRDKVGKLIERVEQARGRLAEDGTCKPVEVVGVLTIPLPREQVVEVRKRAERHGLIVLCREDLEAAFYRTKLPLDPAAVLREWRDRPLRQIFTQGPEREMDG